MAETKQVPVHVWHLEMTEKPVPDDSPRHYDLRETTTPLPELNRFLYASVGAEVLWYMRLNWTWREWHDWLTRETITTWIAFNGATPIGYFELEKQGGGIETEICYFGLLPEFIGKGFGKRLLTDAIDKAWETADKRIWLHTCTLDHPSALPNYLRRGFRIFREEDVTDTIPADPLQPWPGAGKYAR